MTFERYHVDNYLVILNVVNHSVALIDFSTPVAGVISFELFNVSGAGAGMLPKFLK